MRKLFKDKEQGESTTQTHTLDALRTSALTELKAQNQIGHLHSHDKKIDSFCDALLHYLF